MLWVLKKTFFVTQKWERLPFGAMLNRHCEAISRSTLSVNTLEYLLDLGFTGC